MENGEGTGDRGAGLFRSVAQRPDRPWSSGLLDRALLRRKLAAGKGLGKRSDWAVSGELGGEAPSGFQRPPEDCRPAAVLVPLVDHPGAPSLLLTRRTAHLANHAGQIAFPGGRSEPEDASAEATALREAAEEIGLPASLVDILGRLDDYVTVTGFCVTPIVGVVSPAFRLIPDPFEVEDAFEVPLAFVLDGANHRRETRLVKGERRAFYAMPYGEHYIWGATAAMLMNLHAVLGGTEGGVG
ncbi:CoA pyrophosphatase [Rhodospirillum rubrum]|uniref:CoA pyrophosphatase n=1 Tax=Rhodospirillum rubrum TaxID=1085 RepID=UPI001906B492|nr:CoA pyrophosphatase [Rhodospirillum rubrum]MBK1663710.1 CoA pyrophosphatase [Rhodospirillum rubrum]MBK1676461.1 CoA pyrophosphatase [Rhodospirillum rubrum]